MSMVWGMKLPVLSGRATPFCIRRDRMVTCNDLFKASSDGSAPGRWLWAQRMALGPESWWVVVPRGGLEPPT